MGQDYRELITITGLVTSRSRFLFTFDTDQDSKADFWTSSNEVAFQAFYKASEHTLRFAHPFDGGWRQIATLPAPADKSFRIELTSPTEYLIKTSDGELIGTRTTVTPVLKVSGTGSWPHIVETFDGADPSAEPLVSLPEIGPEGFKKEVEDDLVFDFGLFNGSDTEYYLWLGRRVVAIEANPVLAKQCAVRYSAEIAAKRLTILNCAVSDERGTLPFYVNTVRPAWSSTSRKIASRGLPVDEVFVEMVKPEDVFAAFGVPKFTKIDIEGADRLVLKSLSKLTNPPPYISFEIGSRITDEIIDELVRIGYTSFSIVDQRPNYLKCDIRLESAAHYPEHGAKFEFRRGSSGYTGDRLTEAAVNAELLKSWMVWFREQVRLIVEERERTGTVSPNGMWFDVHARMDPA